MEPRLCKLYMVAVNPTHAPPEATDVSMDNTTISSCLMTGRTGFLFKQLIYIQPAFAAFPVADDTAADDGITLHPSYENHHRRVSTRSPPQPIPGETT
jgi:hypothetical protein